MSRNFIHANIDYVNAGNSLTLQPAATTMACWVKQGGNGAPMARNDTGNSFYCEMFVSGTTMQAFVNCSGGGVAKTGVGVIPAGVWTHMAFTYDSTNGLNLYVNGVSVGTSAAQGTILQSSTASLYIGSEPSSLSGNAFTGNITDAAVWNSGLSSAQILSLANGSKRPLDLSSGLVGYWPLSGLSSPEPDKSGNNNNGTVTGTTPTSDHPSVWDRGARSLSASTDKIVASGTMTNSGVFSFAGWVNATASAGTVRCIWRDNAGAGATGAYIDSTNKLSALLNSVQRNTANAITLGIWYHFAFTGTIGSSVAWLLYVNGVLDTTTASINTPIAGGATTNFGNDGSSQVLKGVVSDLAFWNATLSSGQIAALAAGTRPINVGSPIGYWPLDSTTSPEQDLSGNGNTGTVTGTLPILGPPAVSRAMGS